MPKQVIKRDGTKEPFNSKKIRKAIKTAAEEAGLMPERIGLVTNQVSNTVLQSVKNKEEVATSELKEKILGELDRIEPAAAAAWRKYDQERGRP